MSNVVDFRNIEKETLRNADYRRVVYTKRGEVQVVLMCLNPGENIPREKHDDGVQFMRVERGDGVVRVASSRRHRVTDGSAITITSGVYHYVANTSKTKPLKLYIVYCPPQHAARNLTQRRQPPPPRK